MLHLIVISLISLSSIFSVLCVDTSNRVGPNCNHYFGQPITNECINQDISDFPNSYRLQCTGENKMAQIYYQGLNCNESRLAGSYTEECDDYDCYCGALTNECEIAEVAVTYCNSTDQQDFKFVIDECLADVDNRSHILGCQQGHFYRLAFNTTDCSGDEYIQMNFPQDCETESPFEVGVICKTNDTELQSTSAEMPESCNFYQGIPMNECMSNREEPNSGLYIKYNCINERRMAIKYYTTSNCKESELIQSEERECTYTYDCYCGTSNNQCEVADVSKTNCFNPVDTTNYKVVVNECLGIGDDWKYSFRFRCTENGGLNGEYYVGQGCSGDQIFDFHYSHSCENATHGFITSCIERGESMHMTTEEPIVTTTASRLCEKEYMLQEYNNCGIFRYNGDCSSVDALIYQNKTGEMAYSECCAKCNEMNDCKAFSFGKPGVMRQNWCNIYSSECSDNGDTDWYMFTPINNVDAICNSMM